MRRPASRGVSASRESRDRSTMSGQAWAPQAAQLPLRGPAKVCPQNQPWTWGVGAPKAREGGGASGCAAASGPSGKDTPRGGVWGQDPGRRAGAGETPGLQEARGSPPSTPSAPRTPVGLLPATHRTASARWRRAVRRAPAAGIRRSRFSEESKD